MWKDNYKIYSTKQQDKELDKHIKGMKAWEDFGKQLNAINSKLNFVGSKNSKIKDFKELNTMIIDLFVTYLWDDDKTFVLSES